MRILVVGAGATGGYFGGRLLQAGKDVTFLVRPRRAAILSEGGLVIKSPHGDATLASPPTVQPGQVREPYDVVLLSCKSYDLDAAIDAIAPAVGPQTAVVSVLNGMRHLDVLDGRLGAEHVLGGQCLISAKLDDAGRVLHLSEVHAIAFGARSAAQEALTARTAAALGGAPFDVKVSEDIVLEMWEKWVFLATLAGITCLMRGAVGDVASAGGADLSTALLEECRSIAATTGRAPRPNFLEMARRRMTEPTSPLMASMLGDLERGGPTEADHILGDLLRRRGEKPGPDHSLLRVAFTCLKAAEARREREASGRSNVLPR